ncbi:WbqC family protein [Tamlana sp. 2_MG-2023]|uniref:WbqC family protein n=1 Tax=unclassified Tamlana TaxID=2614803 RepID=UPI0026E1E475|nr:MULTISPECIES: WbqC family protein [unclassified Tamlana]MDO6760423.1 WbqC family protein [Tamlana sp. 2_MG-2023]MDO6789878.1 WbqC family protein [Tamlana sp. 1_MG-2023]
MSVLIHPTYFPSIAQCIAIVNTDTVVFETDDNFLKQTYRNRCYIYGANGKLTLNIPVVHSQKNRQKYKDVKIFNDENWQSLHWKSLLSAYRTSPFFEYYEDELQPLFTNKSEFILDHNLKCMEVILDCLQLELNTSKTQTYKSVEETHSDYRFLVHAKKEITQNLEPYTQVFGDKHGFIPNLSILDLLFNEGPNTLNYLESQTLIRP